MRLIENHDAVLLFCEGLEHAGGYLRVEQVEVVEDYDIRLFDGLAGCVVGTLHFVPSNAAQVLHREDAVVFALGQEGSPAVESLVILASALATVLGVFVHAHPSGCPLPAFRLDALGLAPGFGVLVRAEVLLGCEAHAGQFLLVLGLLLPLLQQILELNQRLLHLNNSSGAVDELNGGNVTRLYRLELSRYAVRRERRQTVLPVPVGISSMAWPGASRVVLRCLMYTSCSLKINL